MSGADELAWRDGQNGRALVSNAARRSRVCCSCLSTAAAPGDTCCDDCRKQLPPAGFQLVWAAPAVATGADGAPIDLHPDQLDLTEETNR